MLKTLPLVSLALLLFASHGHTAGSGEAAVAVPRDEIRIMDKAQRNACDCCDSCRAAVHREVAPQKKERPAKNGCGECCARCGKAKKPSPQDTPPPEILEK